MCDELLSAVMLDVERICSGRMRGGIRQDRGRIVLLGRVLGGRCTSCSELALPLFQ